MAVVCVLAISAFVLLLTVKSLNPALRFIEIVYRN